MKKVIIVAVLAMYEIVGAVGADVKDAAEKDVKQKVNDVDAFSGTFIGLSFLGSQRLDLLEYKKIHNVVTLVKPLTTGSINEIQKKLTLHRYLSTVAGDAGAIFLTDINRGGDGNITGYTAWGPLSGDINKSSYRTPGASITLSHNRRVYDNKIIGINIGYEFLSYRKKRSQADFLKEVYESNGLGWTERYSSCLIPTVSLQAGIVSNNELYYIALGIRRLGLNFNTEINTIKMRKITPTIALGTALAKGGCVYSFEIKHSFKVGQTCRTTYSTTTFGLDDTTRANCPTVTTLDTRASSQETCVSITVAKKIF
jgi:hypothetical protein